MDNLEILVRLEALLKKITLNKEDEDIAKDFLNELDEKMEMEEKEEEEKEVKEKEVKQKQVKEKEIKEKIEKEVRIIKEQNEIKRVEVTNIPRPLDSVNLKKPAWLPLAYAPLKPIKDVLDNIAIKLDKLDKLEPKEFPEIKFPKYPEFPKIPPFPKFPEIYIPEFPKIINIRWPKTDKEAIPVKITNHQPQYIQSTGGGGGTPKVKSIETPEIHAVPVVNPDGTDIIDSSTIVNIRASDSASIDAFSRWRVSEANYVFDTNFEYDLQPLVLEAITAESGATVTHDSTNRNVLFTTSSTPADGKAYMQTYEHFRYQAGRSQLALLTFNFIETEPNTVKFVGYSNGSNGIELQQSESTVRIALLSDTAKGDEIITQNNWNLDPMDGTGPSGITVDWTKTHILVIDFQWLGVGRIRCGLDIDGLIYYFHQFDNANHQTVAYMQTANLPLRAGMICSGTSSTTMRFICASVSSEGGETDIGGYNFSQEGTVVAGSGTATHILSVRPKTTFNSIANRSKFVLEGIDIVVTGNFPVNWKLCLGQAISGTTAFNDVNGAYSGTEYNIAGTISGDPGIIVAQGYVAASASSKATTSARLSNKYPITLNQAGAVRANGTYTIVVIGIGGTSATRAVLNWREIR